MSGRCTSIFSTIYSERLLILGENVGSICCTSFARFRSRGRKLDLALGKFTILCAFWGVTGPSEAFSSWLNGNRMESLLLISFCFSSYFDFWRIFDSCYRLLSICKVFFCTSRAFFALILSRNIFWSSMNWSNDRGGLLDRAVTRRGLNVQTSTILSSFILLISCASLVYLLLLRNTSTSILLRAGM